MVMMNVSEARAALPDLLSRVEGGEEVTITRHGKPVAVLVRPDALRARRARAALTERPFLPGSRSACLSCASRVTALAGLAGPPPCSHLCEVARNSLSL